MTRETAAMDADLSINTRVAESLQRLSENLHSLLHSMAGEEPPNTRAEGSEHAEEGQEELLERVFESQEDWGLEREAEIERLERENDELRKMLGIDKATAEEHGWTEGDPDLTYQPYVRIPPPAQQSPRQPAPRALPPPQQYMGMGNYQMQSGVQQNQNYGPPQQRAGDSLGAGMRGNAPRRASMFGSGQRGRGGGPQMWDGGHTNTPVVPERPWQAQLGLDLS